jgi:hypothetical protein
MGSVLAGLSAVLFTDVFILAVSAFMILVAATTLTFQLYKWWRPEHNDPHRYGEPDAPRLPGVVLVPMRHEEAVAGQTLERLAQLNHPDYWVVPIIDHPDDPGTAAIAHGKAREHPGRVLVCPYPEQTEVHNKPIGLMPPWRCCTSSRSPLPGSAWPTPRTCSTPTCSSWSTTGSAPPGRGSCSAACS